MFVNQIPNLLYCSCLIKGWKDVISKLHLSNGSCPCYSCSDSEACNALLAQGSVEHAVLPVLVLKADSTSETIKYGNMYSGELNSGPVQYFKGNSFTT